MGIRANPETYLPYAFASGNPFKWRDPTGRFFLAEIGIAGMIQGILASIALPSFTGFFKNIVAEDFTFRDTEESLVEVWIDLRSTPWSIELDNPKQLVDDALNGAGWRPLGVIQIIDHGSPEGFQIGDNAILLDTWSTWSGDFARLAGKFAPRGYLELRNCYAGLTNNGLLQFLADAIRAPVLAWTGETDDRGIPSGIAVWTQPNYQ